jgi:hypothetical protein
MRKRNRHDRTRNFLVPGLIEWIECHHSISMYVNAYYLIFLILALIAFAGITLATSMFYFNNKASQGEVPQDKLHLFGNDTLIIDLGHDRMAACNWQFEGFTIEDMVLLAALAYQPTEQLQTEINHFYPPKANELGIMRIDTKYSQFQSHGYGNVTYFTLVTPNTIIVSIRGKFSLFCLKKLNVI